MDYSRFAGLYDSFIEFQDDLVEEGLGSSGPLLEGTGETSSTRYVRRWRDGEAEEEISVPSGSV